MTEISPMDQAIQDLARFEWLMKQTEISIRETHNGVIMRTENGRQVGKDLREVIDRFLEK